MVRRLVSTLLDKIASGAAVGEPAELEAFQSEISALRERVEPETGSEALLLHTAFAAQALETYNRGVNRFHRQRSRMMQSTIDALVENLVAIGGENAAAALRLREIVAQMKRTSDLTQLETLKAKFDESLDSAREEMLRQKAEKDSLILALRREIERGPAPVTPAGPANLDATTKAPAKDAALNAMYQPIATGKHRYAVAILVNRIQPITARFGPGAGDRVLHAFALHIARQLDASDQLFRWTGSAFVVLLDRSETLDEVRLEMKRTMEARLEETFMFEGRSVLIAVSAAWSAFQLVTTVTEVERKIETFIASQGSRE